MRIVALVVVGVLFAWILSRLDLHELGTRLANASPVDLALMVIAWLTASLLRPVRFRFLLRVLGQIEGVSYRTAWAALVLGAAVNAIAPMRAGDVMTAVFLRQTLGIDVHRSLTVIIADWACDFACVATVFLGALTFAPAPSAWIDQAVIVLVVILLVGIVGLWIVLNSRARVLALLDRVLARMVPRWRVRGCQVAEEILAGLAAIASWKIGLPLLLISALIWGFTWLAYWLGLHAVFMDAPAAGAAFNVAAVALSVVVPLGPGGLGAFEAASVLALTMFEIPLEAALAFAVIAHFLQLGSVLAFTVLAILMKQFHYRSLRVSSKAEE